MLLRWDEFIEFREFGESFCQTLNRDIQALATNGKFEILIPRL